jgi:hypothetical protein
MPMPLIQPERDENHPIRCMSKSDGSVEWVTLDYAAQRLAGYYREDHEFSILGGLQGGLPMQTMSFIYQHGDFV